MMSSPRHPPSPWRTPYRVGLQSREYQARNLRRRLILSLLAFPALTLAGALGYQLIEGWPFSDALFMAATTITTVGYGEVRPLSETGRIFTIVLLVVGLAAIWYALSVLVGVALAGELGHLWEERRVQRQVRQMRGHHIVAGFGRVGRETALALQAMGQPVLAIDRDATTMDVAAGMGFPVISGDATEDAILSEAGIERAAGLIAALGSDADNVFVTLSARALNSVVPIVARANEPGAVPKLMRAGASQVVSPYDSAGRQMARLALRPGTVDFVESLFKSAPGGLLIEDVRIEQDSPLSAMTVREARDLVPGALVLAIRRGTETIAAPGPDIPLSAGDLVAAVGEEHELRLLERSSQRSSEDMSPESALGPSY